MLSLRASDSEEAIHELYLEWRVACQYAKTWDRVEDCVTLVMMRESNGSLPTAEDVHGLGPFTMRGGSPSYWMQEVDIPQWFRTFELGLGTDVNVFDTARTLTRDNARRRKQYAEQLANLSKAREVLSRTVKG